jgi:hypothetical protein
MPTAFGNVVRSFEEYASEMYGFDAVEGWTRLIAVIPKDYRELIESAKAETDLWINLWFVSVLIIFDYSATEIWRHWGNVSSLVHHNIHNIAILSTPDKWQSLAIPVGALILSVCSCYRARLAAIEWGSTVKAAFDLFLGDLSEKLGFIPLEDNEKQRARWRLFSQAIIFKRKDLMPERPLNKRDTVLPPQSRNPE